MKRFFVYIVLFLKAASLEDLLLTTWDTPLVEERRLNSSSDGDRCGQRPLLPDNGVHQLLTNRTCNKTKRVVGGFESIRNSWPAICSLREIASPNSHVCGSSLIKNQNNVYFLLTAAHCFKDDHDADHYFAYCGIHNTSSYANETNSVKVTFEKLFTHPLFNQVSMDYDVAVFTISSSVPTNDYISPVCLPNEGWVESEKTIVVGWGSLHPESIPTKVLHQVTLPIMSRSTCKGLYGSEKITDRMFCAGLVCGGIDACVGDSGGPLYGYINSTWTLVGIVSWGYGCADPGYTSVYTDVIEVKGWINTVIHHTADQVIG